MRSRRLAGLALGMIVSACGGDGNPGFSPTDDNVAGEYEATTLTITTTSGTTNLLGLGATLAVALHTSGATTGHLFVPGGAEDGSDFDADLTGTWDLTGTTVTFDQDADTFIRDVEFTATENRLTAEETFDDGTVRVVLTKGS
jgi:hypothetical protein